MVHDVMFTCKSDRRLMTSQRARNLQEVTFSGTRVPDPRRTADTTGPNSGPGVNTILMPFIGIVGPMVTS